MPPSPGNGELHSQYHGYYVKAEVMMPPDDPEDEETPCNVNCSYQDAPTCKAVPHTDPKPVMAKESKPEPKLKKQDSLKPKSLAETKKASMEITTDIVEEESVSSCTMHDIYQ